MKLTAQHVAALQRPDIGRDGRQKLATTLGVDMKISGWPARLVGLEISQQAYDDIMRFVELPRVKGMRYGECEGQRQLF